MFWDKKKQNGLPDLPLTNDSEKVSISDYERRKPGIQDSLEEGVHELPSFPDSPMQKGFSQAAIKDAVANEDISENDNEHFKTTELPEPNAPPRYSVIEMDNWSPTKSSNLTSVPVSRPMRSQVSRQVAEKPVFVRLDKFQTARNSLDMVREKLDEAENLLKKIREVKMREDQELILWEKEMETIKARIKNVLTDIFERTEQY